MNIFREALVNLSLRNSEIKFFSIQTFTTVTVVQCSQLLEIRQLQDRMNTSNEVSEESELRPFEPPVLTETGSDDKAIGVVEDDVKGADIGRDGRSGDEERGEAESVENDSAPDNGVRC